MTPLQKFKTTLLNELDEQGFSAVANVFEKIEASRCEYNKVIFTTLRNEATTLLSTMNVHSFIDRIKIFIGSLKGDTGFEVQIRYRVPFPPNFFIGRGDKLNEIHDRLTGAKQISPILLLSGMGGMGKTTLMQEYLNQSACQEYFNSIAFVVINKNLKSAFTWGAAAALGLGESMKTMVNPDKQLEFVLLQMAQCEGNNLFVVDNVNESDYEELKQMRKHFVASGWKFLVTTRTVPDEFKEKVMVDELAPEDALLLFAYHYAPDEVSFENKQEKIAVYIAESRIRKGVEALLRHILRHTLLTELLAKTGKVKGVTPAKILHMLKEQDSKYSGFDRTINAGSHADNTFRTELNNTTVEAYITNLFETEYLHTKTGNPKQDEEHAAIATMLRFFSILPPDDMPVEDLKILWQVEESLVNTFEDRLHEIKQIGWIQGKQRIIRPQTLKQNLVYKMHPLVQEVVYKKLNPNIETCRRLVTTITEILSGTLQQPGRFQKYAQSVINNLDLLHEKK
jgi:NB-ARC domain